MAKDIFYKESDKSIDSSDQYLENLFKSPLYSFLEDMNTGLVEVDRKGIITNINSIAARLLESTTTRVKNIIIWESPWLYSDKEDLQIPKENLPFFLSLKESSYKEQIL